MLWFDVFPYSILQNFALRLRHVLLYSITLSANIQVFPVLKNLHIEKPLKSKKYPLTLNFRLLEDIFLRI